MDESCDDGPSGIFVVGGLVARGVPLFELERKWEKLRKRPDIDIGYFKAVECKNGRGEFKKFVTTPGHLTKAEHDKLDRISREFLSLITKEKYIICQGVGVPQSDFYHVIQDPKARAVLGDNPYRLAYDFAIIQCAWMMKQLEQDVKTKTENVAFGGWSREIVSYAFDKHQQYSNRTVQAYESLKLANPVAAQYTGTLESKDDKEVQVLQAADAIAFEIRRVLNREFGTNTAVRNQFLDLAGQRKVAIISHTTKDQLMYLAANHEPGEPFKLDKLMERELSENIEFSFVKDR